MLKLRWMPWAPSLINLMVSVDVKQHFIIIIVHGYIDR